MEYAFGTKVYQTWPIIEALQQEFGGGIDETAPLETLISDRLNGDASRGREWLKGLRYKPEFRSCFEPLKTGTVTKNVATAQTQPQSVTTPAPHKAPAIDTAPVLERLRGMRTEPSDEALDRLDRAILDCISRLDTATPDQLDSELKRAQGISTLAMTMLTVRGQA